MLKTGSFYDKEPRVSIAPHDSCCSVGWRDVAARLASHVRPGRFVVCVECYPGAFVDEIAEALTAGLRPDAVFLSDDCYLPAARLAAVLAPVLTEDPVFGRMSESLSLADLLDRGRVREVGGAIEREPGLTLLVGTGAASIAPRCDLLVYADMARWEIQQRQRRNQAGNLGAGNPAQSPPAKYKRAFFVDWRVADRAKQELFERIEYLLDTNQPRAPKMIPGDTFRSALQQTVRQPFRVAPFFDPGPWGGRWMQQAFDLPGDVPNYAWGFDCVPEENSLLLGFGGTTVEVPAMDLVLRHPRELLGEAVYARFGAEFPIRFDILDTLGGGNLSLQVHPLAEYARGHFGMSYTQDESYYILEAGEGASVYLGLREGVNAAAMEYDLHRAQDADGRAFPAAKYVNAWPARKHDHFSIPSGTIHCSGRNSVVLEISATPYIFTFKLWDWGRVGLDGEPRPIHLDHGLRNIQWDRTTEWVRRELIGRVETLATGEGWTEQRTGLHPLEFIETRRHWFTAPVMHHTGGSVNVLNLVEGSEAVVESPSGAFEPMVVHYAETFIVPAAVGAYRIRPAAPARSALATVKAGVRI